MPGSTAQSDILALIEGKDFARLKATVTGMEIHDLGALLRDLEDEAVGVVFRLLPQATAADIFGDLELEQQEQLLLTLSNEKVTTILNEMPPDDRTELLEELPGQMAQRLLQNLRGQELKVARSLLAYPEESIGRLMTPEYVAVRSDWTVEMVFRHIRKVAASKETLNVVYVVDKGWRLVDAIPLERLVLAEPTQTVRELMDKQVVALTAREDQEAAIEIFKKYDAVALPVVDNQGVLVGIVTHDDVFDVAEAENTEDFQRMAGMEPLEYSYFGTGFLAMLSKRLPWLVLLLAAQTLTTVALTSFHRLADFTVLVLFMPLINSPAGNTGSQMAGLMIRGLAVQEMGLGDWKRVFLRELARGVALGASLATMGFFAVLLFGRPVGIALSVAMAMVVAVAFANLIGSMLPFVFKRVGLDPAVTSARVIASLMDVSGIVIYFSIATAILAATG